MSVTIYHNPRCSKSRATLALLEERSIELNIVHYLDNPPSVAEITDILKKLGKEPREAMRKGEEPYKARNLGDDSISRDALIEAMAQEPILIERPIVVKGAKARIGRPPESVLEIL
jgi:arsenate reductase